MLTCDMCGKAKKCSKREIEHRQYEICAGCWGPIASKLKGKGRITKSRPTKQREVVLLPRSLPQPEAPEPKTPHPEFPPKIWSLS